MGREGCCFVRNLKDIVCLDAVFNFILSSTGTVTGVRIKGSNFSNFSALDLERLKNDGNWLSDSHVTLILLFIARNC